MSYERLKKAGLLDAEKEFEDLKASRLPKIQEKFRSGLKDEVILENQEVLDNFDIKNEDKDNIECQNEIE